MAHNKTTLDNTEGNDKGSKTPASLHNRDVEYLLRNPEAVSKLLAEHRMLKEAIERSPVAYCVYNRHDELIAANHSYRGLYFGHPAVERAFANGDRITYADVVRGSLVNKLPPSQLEAAVAARVQAQRNADGTPVERDYGEQGIFRIVKYPLSNGAVAGMAIDVSELKENEAQLTMARETAEAMERSKSDFLANMSHELRTPLNAIIGFAELTQLKLDPETHATERQYLDHVSESGNHLVSLIDDLLDISKIEANAHELTETEFSLTELLRSAFAMLTPIAMKNNIALRLGDCPPDLRLLADQRAIKQIVLNLGTNAIRYSAEGCCVAMSGTVNANGQTEISIKDNGQGISEEEIANITKPFVRAKAQSEAASPGAGLGLSIVKALTELHDGEFVLESTLNVGTNARVILPAIRTRSVAGVSMHSPAPCAG